MIVAAGLDAIRGLSAWTERHAQHCVPCRQQAQARQNIERQLTLCAPQARRQVSPFLQSRIMAAWDRELQEPAPMKQPGLPFWSMGLTGGCVALLALLIALHPSFQPEQEPTEFAEAPAGILPVSADPTPVIDTVTGTVITGLSRTLENPLEREMQAMLKGARVAAQQFAQNFLPESDITIRVTREF